MHFGQDAEEVLQYKEVEEDDGFRENGKFGESFVELCQDDVVLVSSNRRFPRLLLTRSEVLRLSGQETLPKEPPLSSVEHVKRENELMGEIS